MKGLSDGRFQKTIAFRPASDRRHPEPKKNYGIRGLNIYFALKGPKGAVTFTLYTGWMLPHVINEWMMADPKVDRFHYKPMPAGLDFHKPRLLVDSANVTVKECEWLDGAPCYCGGSVTASDEVFELFLYYGEEAIWRYLRGYYDEVFNEDDG